MKLGVPESTLLLVGTLLGVLASAAAFGFRFNLSESLPRGLYRLVECDRVFRGFERGELVTIDPERVSRNEAFAFFRDRGWLSFTGGADLVLKRVGAVPGDRIQDVSGELFVNGRSLGREASARIEGPEETPFPSQSFPFVVPEGEVWVASSHSRGIDSRYFGSIEKQAVACKAEALWTL